MNNTNAELFTLPNFATDRQLPFAKLKQLAAAEGIKPALVLNGTQYFDLAALRILEELATVETVAGGS